LNGALVTFITSLRPRPDSEGQGHMVDEAHECARRALACAGACWHGLSVWLEREEPLPARLVIIVDCAESCELTARSLMRGSTEMRRIAALCAEICEQAAAVTSAEDDLAEIALAARRCARVCGPFGEK
jgi:hypothetical protein